MNFLRLSKIKTKKNENEHNSNISSLLSIEFNNENNNEENQIKNIILVNESTILLTTSNYQFELKYTKMKSGNEYFTIFNKSGQYCIIIKKDISELMFQF